ncbi:MAG: DUF1566 domain-containing protein [Deltaproteobacteria bacterium]|nr:DUF1566 domain-containing protein [Deltaproteobacteria bacterium]
MHEIVSKRIIKMFMISILSCLLVVFFFGIRDNCSATYKVDKFQDLTKRLSTTTEPRKIVLINAPGVKIRKGPDLKSDIIGTVIKKGTVVEVIGRSGTWYKVRIGGIEGWAYRGHVTLYKTIDEPKQKQLSNVETIKVIGDDKWLVVYNNSVVKDKKTGLEWYAGHDRDTNWYEAKRWVENLNVAGGGWRMPTIKELKTLYQEGTGTHNMPPLLKTTGWWVWSSETKDSLALSFYIYAGFEGLYLREDSVSSRGLAVRLRSKAIDEPNKNQLSNGETTKVIDKGRRFIAHNNGVVYDKETGLEWYVGPDRDTTWYKAESWVKNLTVDGGGWRMPTKKELKSLYNKGAGQRNMTPLLKTTGWWVWSGEIKGSSSAWGFYFSYGSEYLYSRDSYYYGERGFAVRFRK